MTVRLHIEPDGLQSRIPLDQDSGRRLPDESASHRLDRMTNIPDAIALQRGNSFDLQAPIVYRLIKI